MAFSNYCGLGGSGIPQHTVDELCKEHDEAYQEMLDNGQNPYFRFNKADKIFLDKVYNVAPASAREFIVKKAAQATFGFKKMMAAWAMKPWDWDDDDPINRAGNKRPVEVSMDALGRPIDPRDPFGKKAPTPQAERVKRLRRTFPDADNGGAMDVDATEPTTAAAHAPGGISAGGGKGSHETPVLMHGPTYGLQETHTAILPFTYYFGATGYDKGTPIVLNVRMNSIYDTIPTALSNKASGAAIIKELVSNIVPYGTGTTHLDPAVFAFPAVATGAPVPAWRTYFDKIYQVYTVLQCHWKLTVVNTNGADSEAGAAMVGQGYETFGTSASGNVFPTGATLDETFSWKDISYKVIHGWNNDQASLRNTAIITGSYRPGQQHRNVTNDEDVKTWTAVGSAPAFTERLALMFWQAPFATANLNTGKMNCMLQVKYTVQFKDLQAQARYPTSSLTGSAINQTTPGDALVTH